MIPWVEEKQKRKRCPRILNGKVEALPCSLNVALTFTVASLLLHVVQYGSNEGDLLVLIDHYQATIILIALSLLLTIPRIIKRFIF